MLQVILDRLTALGEAVNHINDRLTALEKTVRRMEMRLAALGDDIEAGKKDDPRRWEVPEVKQVRDNPLLREIREAEKRGDAGRLMGLLARLQAAMRDGEGKVNE